MYSRLSLVIASVLLACLAAPATAQEQDRRKFTTITVHLEKAPPGDVFKAIGDAGGVEFIPPGSWGQGNQVQLNFDLKQQPFWFGALQAAGFYGYRFDATSFAPGDRRVRVFLSQPVRGRKMCLVPPLLVMVEVSKSQPSSLEFVTYADPALRDWVFAGPPEVTELTDAAGESLLPEEAKPQIAAPPGLISRHPVKVKKVTREFSSIKGSFVLLIANGVDEWSMSNPAAAASQERKIENRTYTFTSLRKVGRQYELKLRVKGPADGGFTTGESDLTVGPGSILANDDTGAPWRISEIKGNYNAKQMTATGDYEYTIALVPEKGAPTGREITSIKWRLPIKMENLEIPFHFTELSLK